AVPSTNTPHQGGILVAVGNPYPGNGCTDSTLINPTPFLAMEVSVSLCIENNQMPPIVSYRLTSVSSGCSDKAVK
ncbi:hypothetical protein K469DRAFT_802982, partial [Zopfia rhizophila CBS 207.26]